MKFLLFASVVFGVFYFFYRKLRRFLAQLFQPLNNPDGTEHAHGTSTKPGRINKGEMKQCPTCGIYLPAGTGNMSGELEYCSSSCASEGKNK